MGSSHREAGARIDANTALWALPLNATSKDHSWDLEWHGGHASAIKTNTGLTVTIDADSVTAYPEQAMPHTGPFRNAFSLQIPGGAQLEDALAGFYWGTMLP